ncbi:SRPBCC family protein [Chitinophaga rhizophila]|uniref:SRPBCC domain-containing protein n=1 Tax=Chitinophaga rhizophila TaxID=2866212 RepID=A0ABS7GHD9_9BACT|nr:SRPBCC domain-containing protein [Chitinophaga rhizophila]MBW8687102.1 SRPBCC domain-containing protein [Chitinophaga rhizophila]
MEKKEFRILIDSPRETVWQVLWDDKTYREWTSAFAPGSWAKTDWKKGSKVYFMDAENCGMLSSVAENIPNEYMSFEHLGYVKEGKEDTESPEVKEWAGAHENYTLKAVDGKTELVVHTDIVESHMEYFNNTWPKALEKLKEIAEGQAVVKN